MWGDIWHLEKKKKNPITMEFMAHILSRGLLSYNQLFFFVDLEISLNVLLYHECQ